jgi:CDP-glucose 4,6-dehydratase
MIFFEKVYSGSRVLVTGHTGFKGSWLSEWLLQLGADVHGLALEPDTEPSIFRQLGLAKRLNHMVADIRDPEAVAAAFAAARPRVVFHLAAQPLVRRSYHQPQETFAANIMGTTHVLECVRTCDHPCVAVVVTSDKCYENLETGRDYRESDALGGHDCYSASKAAAEIVTSAYRRSFFLNEPEKRIASARAGNVIGGGDWAEDRIIPDCIRHLQRGAPVTVRNPRATRPWQHVLEPLGGYLELASRLLEGPIQGEESPADASCYAFNFGPGPRSERSVQDLVEEVLNSWSGSWENRSDPFPPHEAHRLSLDISKATRVLDWHPRWDFARTVRETVDWYRSTSDCTLASDFQKLTARQIADYTASTTHA